MNFGHCGKQQHSRRFYKMRKPYRVMNPLRHQPSKNTV
jgi:hypothetical protein